MSPASAGGLLAIVPPGKFKDRFESFFFISKGIYSFYLFINIFIKWSLNPLEKSYY